MSELRGRLVEEIERSLDERSKLDAGSEDRARHDKVLIEMYDIYERDLKLDYDDYAEERRLKSEMEKTELEVAQKSEQAAEEGKHSKWKNILYGVGLGVGAALSLLARRDEKEGFIIDDKVSFFDKFKKEK